MTDVNLNLNNRISFDISDYYLPVRYMTVNNLGALGDVAIIACNPRKESGGVYTFDVLENSKTEYFTLPLIDPLCEQLKRNMFSYDKWGPGKEEFITIKAYVLGSDKIVHVHESLSGKSYLKKE